MSSNQNSWDIFDEINFIKKLEPYVREEYFKALTRRDNFDFLKNREVKRNRKIK